MDRENIKEQLQSVLSAINITQEELISDTRKQEMIEKRAAVYYYLTHCSMLSVHQISQLVGRDTSTIIRAVKHVARTVANHKAIASVVNEQQYFNSYK